MKIIFHYPAGFQEPAGTYNLNSASLFLHHLCTMLRPLSHPACQKDRLVLLLFFSCRHG